MKKRRKMLIIFFLFLLIPLYSYSIKSLDKGTIQIKKSEILIDNTKILTIDEIRKPQFDKKFEFYEGNAFNFGISKNHNWIRFKFSDITNENSEILSKKMLYFTYNVFGDLKIYIPLKDSKKKYKLLYSNLLKSVMGNSKQAVFPIFKLPDNIDKKAYTYVQVNGPYSHSFQIFLDSRDRLETFQLKIVLSFGLLIGIIIAMFLYNGVLFTILKDKLYMYYLIYCFFLIVYELVISGIMRLIISDYQNYFVRYIILIGILAVASYLYFVWNLLNIPKLSKILRYFYYVSWIICGIVFVLNTFHFVIQSNKISYFGSGMISLLVIASVIISIVKKKWISKFYILAMFMSMFSVCVYALKAFAVIEYSIYMNYGLFISMTLEAVFSSFALADKIKKLQKDNEELKIKENQLFIKNQIAEKSNMAKSEFLANMSHEIRTPLSGVIGFNDLLSRTSLTSAQSRYIKNINSSANTLLSLINNILDFSKIEAKKLELEFLNTNIIELVENSIDVIKYQSEKKGLELFLNIKPDVPKYAIVDPLRLNQILINLLGNAVKFTESGKIELSLNFLKINDKKGIFNFSVEDTGIGISKAQESRLFNVFSQGDNSITRKFGGSGLGLVISNMLANKMGSSIKLETLEGVGSKFYFSIETEYQNTDKIKLPNKLKKVLVVSNNKKRNIIIKEKFKYWGIDSKSIEDKFKLLELLKNENSYDLILFEHNIYDKNEIKIIQKIRKKLKIDKEFLPIIFIGNSENVSQLNNISKINDISLVLGKPVKSFELINYIKNIFEKSENFENFEDSIKDIDTFTLENKFRVLIADDFEMNIIYIKEILKKTLPNSILVEVKNGIEAVDEVKNKKFDLIFLDIQMPVMDGIEACQKIRGLNIKTPIIALTADAIKDRSERAIKAGIDEYLTKPLKISSLNSVLKKYLSVKKI